MNTETMLRMQEAGIAALSDTTVVGRPGPRVVICNHRPRRRDLLIGKALRIGSDLAA